MTYLLLSDQDFFVEECMLGRETVLAEEGCLLQKYKEARLLSP